MLEYTFEHDGPVFTTSYGDCETVYYARGKKKYKRTRQRLSKTWHSAREQEIDHDTFWITVACIERRNRHA